MSPIETDFLERFFLALAGLGSVVLVAASIYGMILADWPV
jgi:hypothetical protein